jgi:hypothetical protein
MNLALPAAASRKVDAAEACTDCPTGRVEVTAAQT